MILYRVTLITDGNLVFHKTVQARNPAAAWGKAAAQVERETRFEIDSGSVAQLDAVA